MNILCNNELYKVEISKKKKRCYLFLSENILVVSFYKYKDDTDELDLIHKIEFTNDNYLSLNKEGYKYISKETIFEFASLANISSSKDFFRGMLEYLLIHDFVY